jgi:class 3 adenylate cyclase/tetratricopeptide (TPR) repeat protein
MTEDPINPLAQLNPYLPPHLARYLTPDMELVEAITISNHIRAVREMLSTYLPNYLVRSIYQDPTPGNVSGGFHYGAVLFADVSGFTAMSEKLSVLGKEGAEEVTSIVNNYFTAMLEINDNFGGDLLKFGGDALLIFFAGNLGPYKALATGRAMMNAMSAFKKVQTSQGVFPLRMKIGMACGSVFLASLGTPQSMDHAVMGSTLFNLAGAENNASAGEIVVHRSMQEVTGEVAKYSTVVEGYWKLEELHKTINIQDESKGTQSAVSDTGFDPDILAQNLLRDADIVGGLRSFVPEELFTHIVNDPQRIAIYGTHRPVTITFTNFLGIDEIIETLGADHEDSITAILNRHFVTMSEVITRFGGTVNRLDAYSVGHRILGLFGALQAHDDDPQRAVRAAVEMNNSLEEVNQATEEILSSLPEFTDQFDVAPLKQRIGVNSGFVFGGNTGSKARREYTVMGDQVNLTARLMGIAQEGEVLIGQSTARQTEEVFDLVEKEAVKVKGKTDPVRNYSVTGTKERSHWKTRLATSSIIGRDKELSLGREAIEQAIGGQARVLAISGVSGLGKTRLAEELTWYGDQQGMDLLIGTCLSYGNTMTYHPWAEVLRELFGITAADSELDTSARMDAIQRGMEAIDETQWTPVIGTVLGLEIPDNDLTRDLDPKLRRQRVLDLTVKLLRAKAHSQPLMLVIEDAHWADPASMDLIDYVARNISDHPILFMLPHRPDIGLPEWTAYPHAIDLELADLPNEACKEIIHEMLGGLHLPDAMYHLILSRGCGNPFFIGEVVRALIDAGALEKDENGNFQAIHDMSGVELPDTIHGVIISRIDRLLAADRRILQVASVIGRVFAYRTLDGVYPYEDLASALRERLNYLNELGLTEIQILETELYRFIHLTTREVVYEGLPFEHRRSLHREIGGYIEKVFADNIGEQTSLLAYHYYEGQAWDKALGYNLSAAQYAQREFANDTAILSGERALEAADNLGPEVDTSQERLAAHGTLGEVMTLVGQYDDAFEQIELARKIVDASPTSRGKSHQQAELSRKMAGVFERRSEFETAFEWLEKGIGYLDQDEATPEAARIYLLGTGIYRRLGRNDEAASWCQKSLDLASQIDSREGQQAVGQAYYNLGGIEIRLGDLQSAAKYCRKSLEVYQQIDDVVGQATAYTNLGATYSDLGEWKQAMEAYNKSLAINQQIGDIQREGFLANNLANVHLYRGEWDQAAWLFNQSNAIWKRIGSPLPDAVTLSNLAQVHIYQGNWDQARENLTQSQAIFEEIGSDDFIPELERRWGELYLKEVDLEQALAHTNRSIELATEQDAKLELGMSLRVLGDIHLARGEHSAAGEALNRSLEILQELESDYEAAKTVLVMARLALEKKADFDRMQLEQAYLTFEELEAKADCKVAQSLLKELR